jgi:hypothetical protein
MFCHRREFEKRREPDFFISFHFISFHFISSGVPPEASRNSLRLPPVARSARVGLRETFLVPHAALKMPHLNRI